MYCNSLGNFFFKVLICRLASSRLTLYSSYLRSVYEKYFNNTVNPPIKIDDLSKNILNKPLKNWDDYDVILTNSIFLGDSIKNQYCGAAQVDSSCLDQIISYMPINLQKKFNNHLEKNHSICGHNMYVAKPKVLNEYFSFLFNFYEKIENITNKKTNSKIIEIPRFFGYFNERFSDFWFRNFKKFTTLPMRFLS